MGIIYKAINKLNGKVYIGQSINPLEKRINQHFAESRMLKNGGRFKKALRKYGRNGFNWTVICEANNDKLSKIEDHFIRIWNTTDRDIGYNVLTSHTSYERSDDFKINLSKKIKNQYNNGRVAWLKGKTHSDETKKKIRNNHADFSGKNNPMFGKKGGFSGKKHSDETKKKMREAAKNRNRNKKGKFL